MKVTRDVIYDLLPAYFAGEVSADTRALIEEFFATDPDFGRMAERFRSLMNERRPTGTSETDAERERVAFARVKARVKLRQAALIWGLGALWSFGMVFVTGANGPHGVRHPGVVLGLVFGVAALVTWIGSNRPDAEHWWSSFGGDHSGPKAGS